jgi:Holliday junction resolvase RusA-like endonuclease
MTSITITLPLPAKELSPNASVHWAVKAKVKKQARLSAWSKTKAAMGRHTPPRWEKAMSQCVFYYKTAGRHDPDNSLASCKTYFDGITDAGLLADDSGLSHYPVVLKKDKDNPRVEITIRKVE